MGDDRQARFEALFHAHHEALRRYTVRRTGSLEAAEDVVADAFLVCWRRLDDVPDESLPWLYGVARHTLANHRRAARRAEATAERAGSDRSVVRVSRDPGDLLAGGESIRLALRSLSAPEREAVMLVAWEGLGSAAAARAAGCSRLAFRMRLHRARRRLAGQLGDGEPRPSPAPRPMESAP